MIEGMLKHIYIHSARSIQNPSDLALDFVLPECKVTRLSKDVIA